MFIFGGKSSRVFPHKDSVPVERDPDTSGVNSAKSTVLGSREYLFPAQQKVLEFNKEQNPTEQFQILFCSSDKQAG